MRTFNTAGPIVAEDHYHIPPLARIDLDEVLGLVRRKNYFTLRAPRQTGKTSTLLALRDLLNEQGFHCVYATVETARTARGDVERAMRAVLGQLATWAQVSLGDDFLEDAWPEILAKVGPDRALGRALGDWAKALPKPLVLLIDEIDTLQGDSLLAMLQQLRAGYPLRPGHFPQSMVLCGLRDMRDYRIESVGSPFNIAAKSLRLGDFTREETLALLGQHREETGQAFGCEALAAVWTQTQGQPWLVNALADLTCFKNGSVRDLARPVSEADVFAAREELILQRVTHLDQLADKLKEERVRRVIGPMLSGAEERTASHRDTEYVRDLGLIAKDAPVRIANPIYAEVLPRELACVAQEELDQEVAWYVDAEGGLDIGKLLAAFQDFFRRHSEHWRNRFDYPEAWPQLLLQAFLQRVVNGGGRIEREYGLGRGRVDLLIVWPLGTRDQEFVVECKVLRTGRSLESLIDEGVEQTAAYMARSAPESGHLVVFDQREDRSWDDKLFHRERRSKNGVAVEVWGM